MKKVTKVLGSVAAAVLLLTIFTGAVFASGPNNGMSDGVREPTGTGEALGQQSAIESTFLGTLNNIESESILRASIL